MNNSKSIRKTVFQRGAFALTAILLTAALSLTLGSIIDRIQAAGWAQYRQPPVESTSHHMASVRHDHQRALRN